MGFFFLVMSLVWVLVRIGYRNGRGNGGKIPLKSACLFRSRIRCKSEHHTEQKKLKNVNLMMQFLKT